MIVKYEYQAGLANRVFCSGHSCPVPEYSPTWRTICLSLNKIVFDVELPNELLVKEEKKETKQAPIELKDWLFDFKFVVGLTP